VGTPGSVPGVPATGSITLAGGIISGDVTIQGGTGPAPARWT
jgi:hypothetical protein